MEFGSGGAIALEELRGLADTVTLVRDGVGGNHAGGGSLRRIHGFGARHDARGGGVGRHGGHANRDESETLRDGLKKRHRRCSRASVRRDRHCSFSGRNAIAFCHKESKAAHRTSASVDRAVSPGVSIG